MKKRSALVQRVAFAFTATALAACGNHGSASSALPALDATFVRDAAKTGYKALYLFKGGSDGASPYAGLTAYRGEFYGVTYGDRKTGAGGDGTIFKITASGAEHVLYRFAGTPDGAQPVGNLLLVGDTFYGTTLNGGKNGLGSVFSVTPSGGEHVVYSFKGGSDGTNPAAGLVEYGGKLYGTTINNGGAGLGTGTVFWVTTGGAEHVMWTFKGYPKDGQSPYASLIEVKGELYGTTFSGGANRFGSVFAIGPTSNKERVVYSFKGSPDGAQPYSGLTLLRGKLYGTTSSGTGTVYWVTTAGKEKVIYTFKGGTSDGASPAAPVTYVKGTFYGTTQNGGAKDFGTIFSVKPSGLETMLYGFEGVPKDGANPYGALAELGGALYGTTLNGGVVDDGTPNPDAGSVFKFTP